MTAATAAQQAVDFTGCARTAARLAATLGWSPDTFWSATPAELRTALGLDDPLSAPALAADLIRLTEAFPDGPTR